MEDNASSRIHELKQKIQVNESRDFRITTVVLLTLSIVSIFFSWLLLLGGQVSPGFGPYSIYGIVAVVVLLNILVLRRRQALRKSHNELVEALEKLDAAEKLSLLDPVTETYNQRYLEHILPAEKNRADRTESALSFVMIALEESDEINLKFGAQTGERIINELAQMLKAAFRPTDTIVRYGTDLFLTVMPNCTQNGAMVAVRRLIEQVVSWNRSGAIPGYQMKLDFGFEAYNRKSDIWDTIALAKQRTSIFREKSLAAEARKG
jgi:diguanylate cyclase (GGDEF)-like protein